MKAAWLREKETENTVKVTVVGLCYIRCGITLFIPVWKYPKTVIENVEIRLKSVANTNCSENFETIFFQHSHAFE